MVSSSIDSLSFSGRSISVLKPSVTLQHQPEGAKVYQAGVLKSVEADQFLRRQALAPAVKFGALRWPTWLGGARLTEKPAETNGRLTHGAVTEVIESPDAAFAVPKSPLLTFQDYQTLFLEKPHVYGRNAAQYLYDALAAHGTRKKHVYGHEVTVYDAMARPWQSNLLESKEALEGQELPFEQLMTVLKSMGKQAYPPRVIFKYGPAGSGKTLSCNICLESVVDYAHNHPDGKAYRLVWVFSKDQLQKLRQAQALPEPSLNGKGPHKNPLDQAIPAGSNEFVIPASYNTNPVFLYDRFNRNVQDPRHPGNTDKKVTQREWLIIKAQESLAGLKKSKAVPEEAEVNVNHLLHGQLDTTSQQLWNMLSTAYNGDTDQIFKNNIRVEAIPISEALGIQVGAYRVTDNDHGTRVTTLSPQPTQLPGGLDQVDGAIPNASRGILFVREPLRQEGHGFDAMEPVYQVMDGGTQDAHNPRTGTFMVNRPDVVFVADANGEQVAARAGEVENWQAINRRTAFVAFPYNRRFLLEAKLLKNALFREQHVPKGFPIAPHTMETLGLFGTATRVLPKIDIDFSKVVPADDKTGARKVLADALGKLNSVGLALLYQANVAPADGHRDDEETLMVKKALERRRLSLPENLDQTFSFDELRYLREPKVLKLLSTAELNANEDRDDENAEFARFTSPEGNQGLSTAELITWLADYAAKFKKASLTPKDTIELLEVNTDASEGPWAQTAWGSYYDDNSWPELVKQVKGYAQRQVRLDLEEAVGVIDDVSARKEFERYLHHVSAYVVKGSVDPKFQLQTLSPDSKADTAYLARIERQLLEAKGYKFLDSGQIDKTKLPALKAADTDIFQAYVNQGPDEFRGRLLRRCASIPNYNSSNVHEVEPNVFYAFIKHLRNEKIGEAKQYYGFWKSKIGFHQDASDTKRCTHNLGVDDAEKWVRTTDNLLKMGYPSERLGELLGWAVPDEGVFDKYRMAA